MAKPKKAPARGWGKKRARAQSNWREVFLNHLGETSNVTASANAANIDVSRAYKLRSTDPVFARKWQAALYEGYCHLELDVLRRLREGDYSAGDGHKFDFANAVRILGAHRESAAKERATRANVSADEVRASIDRKVDEIRARIARGETKDTLT